MAKIYCQSCRVHFRAQTTGNHQITSTLAVYSLTRSISTIVANKKRRLTKHSSIAKAPFSPCCLSSYSSILHISTHRHAPAYAVATQGVTNTHCLLERITLRRRVWRPQECHPALVL